MDNEEFKKKRDSRIYNLILQIKRHDETIANIVKSAYERGYADGNSQNDFKIVKITCDSYSEGLKDGMKIMREKGTLEFRRFDEETGILRGYFCTKCGKPKGQIYSNYCANCGADNMEEGPIPKHV